MKILICGDSWTQAWGVPKNKAWPNYLNHDITNVAISGNCNKQILVQFLKNYNHTFDLIIISWSGSTRFLRSNKIPHYPNTHLNEFSCIDDETIKFFKNKSLNDILLSWEYNIEQVLSVSKVPVIQFSVFGDKPLKKYKNFLDTSFLEYLANKQGIFFKHEIPIFEFDWLNENNFKLTGKFGKRYFNRNWQKACVEREQVRGNGNFLPCGHPNEDGHKLWGLYLKGFVDDLFS